MKASEIFIAALLLCPAGCILPDYGLNSGPLRSDCFKRGQDGASGPGEGPGAGPEAPAFDTTLYFCAVRFSDSYDWQRDTAYGSEDYELLLYRDFEPVLCINSRAAQCISPDFDTHHIIDGQLYTERSDLSSTAIGRNGDEIIRFSGRELLKGLLPAGDDIYTLSQSRDGNGFSFRKNGEPLLIRSEGSVFGSMDDPSYGPTGALYLDGGVPVFCYRSGSGSSREYFCVRDGIEEKLYPEVAGSGQEAVNDMKIRDGTPYTSDIQGGIWHTVSCRLWFLPSDILIAGYIRNASSYFTGTYSTLTRSHGWLCEEEATVYCSNGASYAVASGDDGRVTVYRGDEIMHTNSGCIFLSPACAALAGSKLVYALAGGEDDGYPIICEGEKETAVEVNGYISRVAVEISPAS